MFSIVPNDVYSQLVEICMQIESADYQTFVPFNTTIVSTRLSPIVHKIIFKDNFKRMHLLPGTFNLYIVGHIIQPHGANFVRMHLLPGTFNSYIVGHIIQPHGAKGPRPPDPPSGNLQLVLLPQLMFCCHLSPSFLPSPHHLPQPLHLHHHPPAPPVNRPLGQLLRLPRVILCPHDIVLLEPRASS